MRRPGSLAEAVRAAGGDPDRFWVALDEFLDTFYLDHGDADTQHARIAAAPPLSGDPRIDAWTGAVGEHLADRWGLPVPAWVRRPGHSRLARPEFVPANPRLRGLLLASSPPAFRSRMIFTVCEPLQRARFPRDVARIAPPACAA